MSVRFFSIEGVLERQDSLLNRHLHDLFEDCEFVNGGLVRKLEQLIAEYTGAKHAIAVGNASDGLTMALLAAGVGAGDEVIVPAVTFVSSASVWYTPAASRFSPILIARLMALIPKVCVCRSPATRAH